MVGISSFESISISGISGSCNTASGIFKSPTISSGERLTFSLSAAFNSAESSSNTFSVFSKASNIPSRSSISSDIGSDVSILGISRLSKVISLDKSETPISSSGVTETISSRIALVLSSTLELPSSSASSSISISGATSSKDSSAALGLDALSSIASALAIASSSASSSASFSYPSAISSPILYLGKFISAGALIESRTLFIPESKSSPLSSFPSNCPISARSLFSEEFAIAEFRSLAFA